MTDTLLATNLFILHLVAMQLLMGFRKKESERFKGSVRVSKGEILHKHI